jgi:hypothetical protein
MQPYLILDPRGPWQKARLGELQNYAKEKGIKVSPDLGADKLREVLMASGLPPPSPPPRTLGQYQENPSPASHRYQNTLQPASPARAIQGPVPTPNVPARPAPDRQRAPVPVARMSINELRDECKRLGIKMERRDNMQSLRAKINGKQDAPELRQ